MAAGTLEMCPPSESSLSRLADKLKFVLTD